MKQDKSKFRKQACESMNELDEMLFDAQMLMEQIRSHPQMLTHSFAGQDMFIQMPQRLSECRLELFASLREFGGKRAEV